MPLAPATAGHIQPRALLCNRDANCYGIENTYENGSFWERAGVRPLQL